MRVIKFCDGYHHLNHSSGTKVCEPTDSIAWETGYLKLASSEDGVKRKMVVWSKCCFVMGAREWGKLLLGRKPGLDEDNVDITNNL